LPSCVKEDSIRVDGIGTAVIFDVLYHRPGPPTQTSVDEAVAECNRVLQALRKERDVAKEQVNFLNSYGKTLDSKSVNIEDVERFLDMFGPRQVAIAKRIQELDLKVAQAEKDYNKAQTKVYTDSNGAKRGTKITVTVLSETDSQAELMVTYGMDCIYMCVLKVTDGWLVKWYRTRVGPLSMIYAQLLPSHLSLLLPLLCTTAHLLPRIRAKTGQKSRSRSRQRRPSSEALCPNYLLGASDSHPRQVLINLFLHKNR
jgi:hypothetical protein